MGTRPKQKWLLPYQNPLLKRMSQLKGENYFSTIPQCPGVYLMSGAKNEVLYVGKAKNLRERLGSYKRARPGQVSRKVLRMLKLVREIRWEECASEKDALLRENQLIREHRPPFNVVNKRPESYYFIGLRLIGTQIRFRLTTQQKRQGDILYGVFKGRERVRQAFAALLRLIWSASHAAGVIRYQLPTRLTRPEPPHLFTLDVPGGWDLLLKKFLSGRSSELLVAITERLLALDSIPPFAYRMIQEDLELLKEFYALGPERNRRLKIVHRDARGHSGRLISQMEIDDLLVHEAASLGRVADAAATGSAPSVSGFSPSVSGFSNETASE